LVAHLLAAVFGRNIPTLDFFITSKQLEVTFTMARMTQTEILSSLADSCGMKKTDVKAMFDALGVLATNEVKTNGEFTLPGFGKLKKTQRKARDGRNPATGAVIKIPAKTTVKFTIGKAMKDAVA
jgi:DNA-binding protein HU-beta